MSAPGGRLSEFLTTMDERSLTGDLARHAVITMLDNVGCGLYGARQPWSRMMIECVRAQRSSGAATLFGCSEPIGSVHAALGNGTTIHSYELDDVYLGALSHPGAVVVPAALAVAESEKVSGARLLLGVVAGYEMMWRVARALNTTHNLRGFHTTGVAGPLAATTAAAVILGFSAEELNSALGLAASCASGIKAFTQGTGGMVKRMHPGRAAEAGVLACELARRGFSGPQQGIDGRFGLLEVFEGTTARPSMLDQALGETFAISHVHIKVWPCCSLLHSAVQALESLRTEHAIEAERVRRITIRTSGRIIAQNGDPDPNETMAAQYSLPFCAGAALAADARDPLTFEPQNIGNEAVRAVMKRVELVRDPEIDAQFPDHFEAKVEIELDGGKVVRGSVLDAHGTPSDPCSLEELESRFLRLTASVLSPDAAGRVVTAVRGLPEAASIAELSASLRMGDAPGPR